MQRDEATPTLHEADPEEGSASLFQEFVWFLKENKKWWLIPLILVFVMLSVLIVLGHSGALSPFIYSIL